MAVSFEGETYNDGELLRAVTWAAKGEPPSSDDGATWLARLWARHGNGEHEAIVRYALDRVLATATIQHLEVLAPFLRAHPDAFPAETLMNTLHRQDILRKKVIAGAVGAAVSSGVAARRIPYDPQIRQLCLQRKFGGSLSGAVLQGDGGWFLEHMQEVLTSDPEEAGRRLFLATEGMDPFAIDGLAFRIQAKKDVLGDALYDSLREVLSARGALDRPLQQTAEEEAPKEEPQADLLGMMPWRGADGGWYQIPEQVPLPRGPFALRRGGEPRYVRREDIVQWEISAEEARATQADVLQQLWTRGRVGMGKLAEQKPVFKTLAGSLPSDLSDFFGAPIADLLLRPTDGPALGTSKFWKDMGAQVSGAIDEREVRERLTGLADTLKEAAARIGVAVQQDRARRKAAGQKDVLTREGLEAAVEEAENAPSSDDETT